MKQKHTRLKILLRTTQLLCGHKLRPFESRAFACSPQSHCRLSLSLNFHFTSLLFSHPFPRNFYKSSSVNMHIGVQMRVSCMCPLPLLADHEFNPDLGHLRSVYHLDPPLFSGTGFASFFYCKLFDLGAKL